MPYQTHWLDHGVYKRFFGHVTAREYQEASAEVQTHPHYEQLKFSIADFSDVQSYELRHRDMADLIALDLPSQARNPGLLLGVITRDRTIERMTRTLYRPATGFDINVYATLDEALAHMGQRTGATIALAA